jgi:tRNA1(Val) A37 N6-methylase TrmN6
VTQAVTRDAFLNGQVTVLQPAKGYRAGLDAVLLAASLDAKPGDHIAEAGTGAGTALLCAAHRLPHARFTGFEIDPDMAQLAREGAISNNFAERVAVETLDIARRDPAHENAFDQVFSNPPFFDPAAVRAPAEERRGAYLAETPLKDWVLAMHHLAKPGGRLTFIHRAAALADLLELLNPRTGEIEVLPIRPAPGEPAHRILVRARKGLRKGPLRLADGFALHETSGGPLTIRAAEIAAGSGLDWV